MSDVILLNPQPVVLKDIFAEPIMYCNPPLGIGYLASSLRKAGFSVKLFDMGPSRIGMEQLLEIIKEEKPQMVGISAFIANYGNGIKISNIIKKEFPEIKVVMGGPQASFVPEEVLETSLTDYVSMFEGEISIVELAECIINGGNIEEVDGIVYRKDGKVIYTKKRELIKNLDDIPFPAWDLFDIDKYTQPGIVLTGRGCPYKCLFCAASVVSGAKYRMRSVSNVVDEIEHIVNTYNIREFFFADDTFTASESHCVEVCREIRRRNLKITWVAEARANTVNDFVVTEMVKAGCKHVQIGAESGDNEILNTIGKNVTTDIILKAVKTFLRHGVTVVCSFILGNPDDTVETCRKTMDFSVKIKNLAPKFATCKYAILTPLPGTRIYEQREELGIKLLTNNWDSYTFFDPIMETKNLNRRQLQNLYLEAWMKYVQDEVDV